LFILFINKLIAGKLNGQVSSKITQVNDFQNIDENKVGAGKGVDVSLQGIRRPFLAMMREGDSSSQEKENETFG